MRSLATEVLPLLGGEYWSLEACEKVRVLVFVCEALVMAPEVSAVMQRRIAELDAVYEVLETRRPRNCLVGWFRQELLFGGSGRS